MRLVAGFLKRACEALNMGSRNVVYHSSVHSSTHQTGPLGFPDKFARCVSEIYNKKPSTGEDNPETLGRCFRPVYEFS